LYNNLNIIINSAGTVEFDTRLDIATEINVRGPLLLMELAQKCANFESFVQVSTLFAVSDNTGFIDEKIFESRHNWLEEYEQICNSNITEITDTQR
jgi:alcohol-forming fatty acyl-CoA reductase